MLSRRRLRLLSIQVGIYVTWSWLSASTTRCTSIRFQDNDPRTAGRFVLFLRHACIAVGVVAPLIVSYVGGPLRLRIREKDNFVFATDKLEVCRVAWILEATR